MRRYLAGVALACGLHGPALSHPHAFIDAGVEFRFDADGRLEALRIVWVYDDLTSMMIMAEQGLDPDAPLTPADEAALAGFDMNWDAGFEGDTYVLHNQSPLPLGRPESWTAQVAEGRVISTHLRRLAVPVAVADDPLVVQVYDPGYYTAYAIAARPLIRGRDDCSADVFGPDPAAAEAALADALRELSGMDIEAAFPAVGEHYADEVRLTCPPR